MTDVEEEVIVMTETGARGDPAVRKLVRIYLDVMTLVTFVPEHGGFSFEFGWNLDIKDGYQAGVFFRAPFFGIGKTGIGLGL